MHTINPPHNLKIRWVVFVSAPLTCLIASRNLCYASAPATEYAHVVHITHYTYAYAVQTTEQLMKKVNMGNIILLKAESYRHAAIFAIRSISNIESWEFF